VAALPSPPARRCRLGVGLALASLYVAAVAGTLVAVQRPVTPLFDGVQPPPPYRWVDPPVDAAGTNVKPVSNRAEVRFEGGASVLSALTSDDGQIILNLPAGAFPTEPDSTGVMVTFTPLDPAGLGRTPAPLRPEGNAYRVETTYRPSGGAAPLAAAGNIVVTMPEAAETILYSSDGRAWERVPSQELGDSRTLGASFTRAGYYLGGIDSPQRRMVGTGASNGTGGVLLAVVTTAAIALLLGFGAPVVRRLRRRTA
jgi:hypothetical protein